MVVVVICVIQDGQGIDCSVILSLSAIR